ncbi:MAG: hypothetical protein CFE23_16335 [Flavobacterium sp. BFFFF1]|uniref:hypothetical protein n=1 Tax=Flavobacterium sp. BFFFF1 TaxID=2015557 RepID=UPI000BD6B8E0|nr:hypothetical protein [Flavobacterium sp. BFFFF1]OYU78938.1 MAG: hypothetical protein CFE23_16335 [Flavobacterium sp. BFFFF1]
MTQKLTFTTILILLFLSCPKKLSYAEFEQNVFDEIFLKTVNSTYKDKRLYTFFPSREKGFNDPEYLRQRKILENDTIGLVIALDNKRPINFEKIKSDKFIFKKLSEIPEDEEFRKWSEKYPKFAGVMSFSKIRFDNKNENGELDVSYTCGGRCGLGYKVSIKKENQKWVIVKIEQTWIS